MNTFRYCMVAAALLLIGGMGVGFSYDASAQTDPDPDVRYALETGGATEGECTAPDPAATTNGPCTVAYAAEQAAAAASDDGDYVAIRVRRSGETAVVENYTGAARNIILAVYNEDDGTAANDYLLPGTVELRGTLSITSGSIDSDTTRAGTVEIKASTITLGGKSDAITTGTAAGYSDKSTFRNNVVIARSTTMELTAGTCPRFDRLLIPAGVELVVQFTTGTDACTMAGLGTTATETDYDTQDGIAVWNMVDIAGTLELQDDLSLMLNPFRPRTVADKAYGHPSARIDGTVTSDSDSRFYILAEPEMITDIDSLKNGSQTAVAEGDSALIWVKAYTGWHNAHFYPIKADTVRGWDDNDTTDNPDDDTQTNPTFRKKQSHRGGFACGRPV